MATATQHTKSISMEWVKSCAQKIYSTLRTGIPCLSRFLWQLKKHIRRNSLYKKPTFAFSNPSPSAVSRGITYCNLQAQKFALSETARYGKQR